MANTERFGLFYAPWPVIDGKPIQYQWGEIRHDTAELKALARGTFQELQDGQEELNAIRALLGQAYGDIAFNNRYRFYYNKSTLQFCLQKNDGTVDTPVWTDVWCVNLVDGQFIVESTGGIASAAGFYGPGLENIYQIGETGGNASSQESWLHRSKLFFNQDDGFELNEIMSGGNQGGVEVRYTFPFGRAQNFPKVGKEWVVQHDFGISPVLVQVMDDDYKVIIPDTVDVSDENIAYFYFNEVTSGSVYIASGGVGATSLVPRDPFYLVVRTSDESSDEHLLHPNADLVFDALHFYVNVDLVENQATVSLKSPSGAFVTASVGDRNITAENVSGTLFVGLRPKLSGMEAFYFRDGSSITQEDSIHIDSKTGVYINAEPAGPVFVEGATVELSATSDVDIGSDSNVNIDGGGVNISSSGGISVNSALGDIIVTASHALTSVHLRSPKSIILSSKSGVSNQVTVGHDGTTFQDKVKAPAFYFEGGGWIIAYEPGELGWGHKKVADSIYISDSLGEVGILAKATDPNAAMIMRSNNSGADIQSLFPDGSVTLPSLAGQFDTDTGIYWDEDGSLGFSCAGTYQMIVGRDGILVRDKVEANAFYMVGSGELLRLEFNRDMFYLTPKKTDPTRQSVRVVNVGAVGGGSGVSQMPSGTAAVPGFPFEADTDTGFFRPSENVLGIATGGTSQVLIGGDGIVVRQRVQAEAFYLNAGGEFSQSGIKLINPGTAAAPSITFATAPATGFFLDQVSQHAIGFSAGGVEAMHIGRAGMRVEDRIQAEAFYLKTGGNIYFDPIANFEVFAAPTNVAMQAAAGSMFLLASGSIQLHADTSGSNVATPTAVFDQQGLKVFGRVKAPGFYYSPGSQGVAWDLSLASVEIHLPGPTADTQYFLTSFADQPYIIEDVKLASQAGFASFGFYILPADVIYANGVGVVGTGRDGNSLGEFYVGPVIRQIAATASNVVPQGGSLMMTCLSTSGGANVRGRVKIRLQG